MVFIEWTFNRLAEGAAISLVLFTVGSLAVACCRQPVHRLRIILLTLAAAFLAPLINLIPGVPHWTLPQFVELAAEPPGNVNLSAAPDLASANDSESRSFAEQPPVADSFDIDAEEALPEFAEVETEYLEDDMDPPLVVAGGPFPLNAPAKFVPSERPATDRVEEPTVAQNASPVTTVSAVSVAPAFDTRSWVVVFYLTGLAALFVWWLFGMACLWRLVRTATPADDVCRALLTEIAGPAGKDVTLLVSSRAQQPCTFAWRYPVIVLPLEVALQRETSRASLSGDEQPSPTQADAQLRFCLAHEWAHIERSDVWLWSFAGLIRLVYYYQPLCWWLRGQLRLCQDYLADAAAARLASPATYAEFLATRAAGGPLPVGLGIAGSQSELYRRVAMLVQSPLKLEPRCSTAWTIVTVCTALALTTFAATFSGHPDVLAADEASVGRRAAEQSGATRLQPPARTAAALDSAQTKSGKSAAPDQAADASKTDPAVSPAVRKRILDRLATRTTRFNGGTIAFEKRFGKPGDEEMTREMGRETTYVERHSFMLSGTTWFLRDHKGPVAGPTGMSGPGARSKGGMASMMAAPAMSAPYPQSTFTLVDGGRCLQGSLAEGPPASDGANMARLQLLRGSTLLVKHSEAVAGVRERETPFGFGTIYYENGRRFIRKHAAAARFHGIEQLEVPVFKAHIEDLKVPIFEEVGRIKLRTHVIEWDVAGDDASEAFPNQNAFLERGGLLRVYVAEELDDLVARIEGIDRFGTVQFSATFFPSQSDKSGAFQMGARFESGESQVEYGAAELIPAVPKVDNVRFVLGIPVGVRVVDERPKGADQFPTNFVPGAYFSPNYDEYPFHAFTTTASYAEGFPKKLWDEIDRDVMPWDPVGLLISNNVRPGGRGMGRSNASGMESMGRGGVGRGVIRGDSMGTGGGKKSSKSSGPQMPKTPAGATSGKAGGAAASNPASPGAGDSATPGAIDQPAENVEQPAVDSGKSAKRAPIKAGRYGGKRFTEWRQMLVDDLEPETRIKALQAIGTFGANGYAAEAAEAIAGILLTGGEQGNNDRQVFGAACEALSLLGATGIPILQAQLDGEDVLNRQIAVQSLVKMSRSSDAALPALLAATKDADDQIRGSVYPALVERFMTSPEAWEALQTALTSENGQIRGKILRYFKTLKPPVRKLPSDKVLELLRPLLADESDSVRSSATVEFASRAPGTAENVELLKKSLLDNNRMVRRLIVSEIAQSQNRNARADAELMVPVLIALLRSPDSRTENDWGVPKVCIEMLGNLAPSKSAESAIPILVELVDRDLPSGPMEETVFLERVKAIETLGKFGRAAAAALPALKRRLDEFNDSTNKGIEFIPEQLQDKSGLESLRDYQSLIQSAIRKIEDK